MLESSCTKYTLRFSTIAQCSRPRGVYSSFALRASRCLLSPLRLLAVIAIDSIYGCFTGAKTGREKTLFLEAPLRDSLDQTVTDNQNPYTIMSAPGR
jgi:hypothetical protein